MSTNGQKGSSSDGGVISSSDRAGVELWQYNESYVNAIFDEYMITDDPELTRIGKCLREAVEEKNLLEVSRWTVQLTTYYHALIKEKQENKNRRSPRLRSKELCPSKNNSTQNVKKKAENDEPMEDVKDVKIKTEDMKVEKKLKKEEKKEDSDWSDNEANDLNNNDEEQGPRQRKRTAEKSSSTSNDQGEKSTQKKRSNTTVARKNNAKTTTRIACPRPGCFKTYGHQSSVKRHEDWDHDGKKPSKEYKRPTPFSCGICGKGYQGLKRLHNHQVKFNHLMTMRPISLLKV